LIFIILFWENFYITDCTHESYTSKTLWDGSILNNLGGKASILFQGKRVNRDIHGARNILIRFLTKAIEVLSPKEAYS
jgi:hypothetical protein